MKNFSIVNPIIQGSMNTSFDGKTPMDAAIKAYKNMSSYFSNNVPQFSFTMQNGKTYHHFTATEKVNINNKIKFVLKENKASSDNSNLTKFISSINNMEGGGRKKYRYDDSSESSEDSSSDYNYYKPIKRRTPIDYWYYNPNIYTHDYYYVPQFVPTVTPYVVITLSP